MLVYLSYFVCIIGAATPTCHRTVPEIPGLEGLVACQRQGMMMGSQWEEQHPGLKISKIECTPGSPPPSQDQI